MSMVLVIIFRDARRRTSCIGAILHLHKNSQTMEAGPSRCFSAALLSDRSESDTTGSTTRMHPVDLRAAASPLPCRSCLGNVAENDERVSATGTLRLGEPALRSELRLEFQSAG